MTIRYRLDYIMADRKISGKVLAEGIGMSEVNVSRMRKGRVKSIRLETLEPLCRVLKCQPGDLLEYIPDKPVPKDDKEM